MYLFVGTNPMVLVAIVLIGISGVSFYSTGTHNAFVHAFLDGSSAIATRSTTCSRNQVKKAPCWSPSSLQLPSAAASSATRSSSTSLSSSKSTSMTPKPPADPPLPFDATNITRVFEFAKSFVESDLGVRNPNLLSDDFVCIYPNVIETGPLSKKEYVTAGRFFDLRSTFPDFDYRAHDYRLAVNPSQDGDVGASSDADVSSSNEVVVRFTTRTVGTMKGELKLRRETLPPNGEKMICPPEAITVAFDRRTGAIRRLCLGFTMDRLVGNTAGLTGVMGAATIAGAQPSDWEVYPPAVVLSRIFGRSINQLEDPKSLDPPFPESVLVQLAKGVISADNGAKDPDLLATSFSFCGPLVGPIGKEEFVKAFGGFNLKEAFPDLDTEFTNFRVDPFDPYRVWVDGRGCGTWTGPLLGKEGNGARYEGPPEAISFTFDDNGFCTRLTAGAVMDPTEGNTGGLGGVFGILYSTGQALPGLSSRPLPQLLARAQKAIAKPITGSGVDDDLMPTSGIREKKPTAVPEGLAAAKAFPASPLSKVESSQAKASPMPPTNEKKRDAPKFIPPALPKIALPKAKVAASDAAAKKNQKGRSSEDALASLKEEAAARKKDAAERIERTQIEAAERRKIEEAERRAAEGKRLKTKAVRARIFEEKIAAEEQRKRAAKGFRETAAEAKSGRAQKSGELKNLQGKRKRNAEIEASEKATQKIPKLPSIRPPKLGLLNVDNSRGGKVEPKQSGVATSRAEEVAAADVTKKKAEEAARAKTEMEAAAEARKARAEAAAQKRKEEAEKRKTLALEAAEKRRQAAESAKAQKEKAAVKRTTNAAAMQQKKQKAEERRIAATSQATKAVENTSPGVTISLASLFGGLLGGGNPAPAPAPATARAQASSPAGAKGPVRASTAPRGVPTISKWKQNVDGSISGFISGSTSFDDGDAITTSPIKGDASGVVQTTSGSKYFLAPIKEKQRNFTIPLFGGGDKPKAMAGAAPVPVPAQKSISKANAAKAAETKRADARQAAQKRKAAAVAKLQEAVEVARIKKEEQKRMAEERKTAAEIRRQEAIAKKEEQQRLQEERKAAAEAKRQEALAAAQAKKQEQQRLAQRKKAATQAQETTKNASPGATISLFSGLGLGSGPVRSPPMPAPIIAPRKPSTKARGVTKGVPTISSWTQNVDGSISGVISGSTSFEDGRPVTTSPLKSEAVEGAVVRTVSGSKYFLTPQAKKRSATFSLFGNSSGAKVAPAPSPTTDPSLAAVRARKEEQEKRAALKKKQVEERKVTERARKAAAEERRIAAAEAAVAEKQEQRRKFEERKAAAEARKQAAEAKRAAALEAAAQRKRAAEAKTNANKARESVAVAKSGSTISLFGLFPVQDDTAPASAPAPSAATKKEKATTKSRRLSSAPRGVPTLSKWRQNRNGSISAYIFGSSSFRDGETITTSKIAADVAPSTVVETSSGSKYFLDAGMDKVLKDYRTKKRQERQATSKEEADEKRREAERKRNEREAETAASVRAKQAKQLAGNAKPGASISLFGLGGAQPPKSGKSTASNAKKAQQTAPKAKPGATIPLFGDISATKRQAVQDTKPAPGKTAPESKPRATISLFDFGVQREQFKKSAPKGVPSMVRWKRNFDGSVSGFISGSSAFAEGERITTSPIKKGMEIKPGSIVETTTGSTYFLV